MRIYAINTSAWCLCSCMQHCQPVCSFQSLCIVPLFLPAHEIYSECIDPALSSQKVNPTHMLIHKGTVCLKAALLPSAVLESWWKKKEKVKVGRDAQISQLCCFWSCSKWQRLEFHKAFRWSEMTIRIYCVTSKIECSTLSVFTV